MDDTFCSSENLFQKDQSSPKITLPAGVTINDASQKTKTTEAEKNNIDKDNEHSCGMHNDKNKPDVNSNCYLIRHKKRIWTASHCKFSLDVYTLISGVPFLLMNMYSAEAIGRSTKLYYFKEGSRLLPIVTGTYWFIRYWSGLPFKSLEDSFDFQDFLFGLCLLLVGWLFCNYDEYAIFAIKVSGLCLCIDAPIHYLTQFITYRRDISLYDYLILPMNWAGFGFYVFQNLWKITKTISQANIDKEKRRFKRRVGRFIQRDDKLNNAKTSTMEKVKEKCSKNKEETDIPEVSMEPVFCQSYCENIPNLGTVSVNCTARCFLKYHQQCWKIKMDSLNIKNERSILHMDCSTSDCWGKVKEIVSYDASGEELPRKISMTPNEILKFKQKHPKPKKSPDEVKCKPNKPKVERTKRKESETDDQEQRKSSPETAPGKKNVAYKMTASKISSESCSVENNKETSEENVQSENIKSEIQENHENPRIFKKSVSMLLTEESSMDAKMQKKKQKLKKTMSLDEFRADVVNTGMETKDCLEEHKSAYPQQVFSPSKPPILPAYPPPTSPPLKPRYSTPPPSLPPKFSVKGNVFPPKPVIPLLSRFSTPPPPIPKQIVQKNISTLPPPTSSVHFSEPKSKQHLDTSKHKTTNPFFDQIPSQRSSMYSDIQESGGDHPLSTTSKDCLNGPTHPMPLPSLGSTPTLNLFQKHPLSPSLLPLSTAAQQITLSPFISPLQLNISSTTFEKEIPTSSSPFISPIQMNIPSTTFEKEISSSPDLSPPLSSIQSSMTSFSRDLPMSSHFSSHISSLSDHLLTRSDSRNFLGYPLFQRSTNLKWHSEDTMDSSDNSDMIDEDEEHSEQIKTTGSVLQIGNEWNQSKYTKNEREINVHKTPTVEFVHDCQNQTTTQGRQNLTDGQNIIHTFIYCPGEDSHSVSQYEKDNIDMSSNTQEYSLSTTTQINPIKSNQMENIIESISPVSHPSDKNLSPLTKIVAKKFPHISISDINVCLEKVLSNYDVANTTLSEFINLIGEQVESVMDSWKDEIYMSDEDDSVTEPSELHDDLIDAILEDLDECAICTELLEVHLETMDPCGHIFHTECIRSWAKKEATCPQCRANIQFSP